jgi:cyclopentanol dehydrogenase
MKDKVCLITGGTAGIGFGTANLMCDEGARVIITGRDRARGRDAESRLRDAGGDARYMRQDTSLPESWQRVIEAIAGDYGALHVLVNNAGVYMRKPMIDCSLDDFDRIMSVNLRAVFIGIQAALPLMRETAKEGPSGSIINFFWPAKKPDLSAAPTRWLMALPPSAAGRSRKEIKLWI